MVCRFCAQSATVAVECRFCAGPAFVTGECRFHAGHAAVVVKCRLGSRPTAVAEAVVCRDYAWPAAVAVAFRLCS